MKRSSFFGLFSMLIVLFACNDKTADTTTSASTDNNKELLESNRAVQKAIETGDTATLRKYISEDAVDHGGGPNGGDLKGNEIITMLGEVHKSIDNFKMETIEEAANGDVIFSVVRTTGTTNKPIWGMPANYKMDGKSVDVIKVKDKKMVDHWSYMDPADMMKMMNAGAPPATANGTTKMGKDSAK